MTKEDTRTALSSDQNMTRALFYIAKRAWYKDQRERDAKRRAPRPEPPEDPVPGQGWFADPSTLQIQLDPFKTPIHEGSSVKIDRRETEIHQAFRPRPFLVVSDENLLLQKRAWVCPLSQSAGASFPEWVVPLPELKTFALASKLHTVDTEFFADVAKRDLLRAMENYEIANSVIGDTSKQKIRAAIEKYLAGTFAPKRDALPPGSILRYPDGSERFVLANCYLGDYYRDAGTLTTTCRLKRTPPPEAAGGGYAPGIVPLPGPPPPPGKADAKPSAPVGYLDLGRVASEMQARVQSNPRVGQNFSVLPAVHNAFQRFLLGRGTEEASP